MHAILGVIALILSATSLAHLMHTVCAAHTSLIAVISAKRWYQIVFSNAPGRIFSLESTELLGSLLANSLV